MSAPGSKDDGAGAPDPAAGQALPADAGVAAAGGDEQAPPPKASTGGPSGTVPGSPGGLPAGVVEKLPIDPELLEQRPEILVGGAFVAGFLLARIIRAIGGD